MFSSCKQYLLPTSGSSTLRPAFPLRPTSAAPPSQALHASIDTAALAEDAAAAVRLEAEGRRLDGLAESLQALEGRQGGLQVRTFALV